MIDILDIDLDADEAPAWAEKVAPGAWIHLEAPKTSGKWKYRDYQVKAVDCTLSAFRDGKRRILIVIFTGGGKTVVFTCLTNLVVSSGGKVLILAHSDELLGQAAKKLKNSTGLEAAKEKADERASPFDPVVVASVQTLRRRARLEAFARDHFSLIIVDESHRSLAKSYRDILDYFTCPTVGVTATPSRGDKKCLSEIYETFERGGKRELAAFDYGLMNGVMDGWAVRLELKTLEIEIDAHGVLTTAQVMAKARALEKAKVDGLTERQTEEAVAEAVANSAKSKTSDLDGGEVAHRIEPLLSQIAKKTLPHVKGRRQGIVFLPSVKTARMMAFEFNAVGLRAVSISGEDEDRDDKCAAYLRGEYDVLCNAMLYTEGFDHDQCDWVMILRLTKVDSLYKQMVGRITRPLTEIIEALNAAETSEQRREIIAKSGKPRGLILDPLWLTDMGLNLASPYCVLGKDPRVVEKAAKDKKQGDLLEIEKEGERDLLKSLEKAAAKNAGKKAKTLDPLALSVSLKAEDLAHYEPKEKWEYAAPSRAQLDVLAKHQIDVSKVHTAGMASQILNRLHLRQQQGLCSVKQMTFMEKHGVADAAWKTAEEARRFMLSKLSGWKKRNAYNSTPRPAAHAKHSDSLPLH